MKRGILFLNLGGPEKLEDVRPFLYRLFEDPEVIRIKFTPLRKMIAWLISATRHKQSEQMYKNIGGGSPILKLTDDQAKGVQDLLKLEGFETEVRTAFTCSDPLVEDVVRDLAKHGVQKFLSFPLYPQYSFTTTKGALDRTRAAVKTWASSASLYEINSWPTHPLFLQAHAEMIREVARQFTRPNDNDIHIIFSAHSIPEKLVTKLGDPYKNEMEQTVKGVLEKADWKGNWTLSWQSKLGPVKWIGPTTEDTIKKLGGDGVKQILVVPIAFVTDHIETLFELDQLLAGTAKESGIEEFRRTSGLNTHPTFLKALVDLALSQKDFWR
jgi:ferrochelatase